MPDDWITDHKWHNLKYHDLPYWVKKRIKQLNRQPLTGRTFLYRRNPKTGIYQRKLRYHPPRAIVRLKKFPYRFYRNVKGFLRYNRKLTTILIVIIGALIVLGAIDIGPLATYLAGEPQPETELWGDYERTETESKSEYEVEVEIYESINWHRTNAGIPELQWNEDLHNQARLHSQWMLDTGNFVHSDCNCWENIFWCAGYSDAVLADVTFDSWMNSYGHNQNMLESEASKCGVGVAKAGDEFYATYMAK